MGSQTFGSFVRNGNYPLEADYIFNSVEDLQQWHAEQIAKNDGEILHDGLLKIVKSGENQILYWCYNKEFYPLCDLNTFENLEKLQEFVGKADTITDWLEQVNENLHKGLHNIQKELDLTQLSIGLNPSGTLDPVCLNNTNYLVGARTIIGCLEKLDKAISESASYSIEYKDNYIYLLKDNEKVGEIDASEFVKDGMIESVVIEDGNLVITWNSDSEIEPTEIAISKIFNADDYLTKKDIEDTYETKQHAEQTYLKEHQDLTEIYNQLNKLNNSLQWGS